jgi:hypothetical protein
MKMFHASQFTVERSNNESFSVGNDAPICQHHFLKLPFRSLLYVA